MFFFIIFFFTLIQQTFWCALENICVKKVIYTQIVKYTCESICGHSSDEDLSESVSPSLIEPASHMYRFTCSHQGAACLTQSCFSSIWPLCSSTGAAGGLFPVQGHLSGRWGRRLFLICLPTQIFSDILCRQTGDLLVTSLLLIFLFYCCPSVCNALSRYLLA